MRQIDKRPLATAATIVLVAGGVLAAVYALGQYALGRMMADDALTRAELWTNSLSRGGVEIEAALAGTRPETLEGTLRIANIDRVLLIPESGNPIPVHGPDASAELKSAVASAVGNGMSLGKIMKAGVETVGPKITKTEMKLDSASLQLLGGSGTLKGFTLGNPGGYKTAAAIKAGSVGVGVKPGSLFSDKVVVRHVRVEGPEITFEGSLGTANNLSKILDNVKETTGGATEQPKADSKSQPPSKSEPTPSSPTPHTSIPASRR